MVKWRRWKNRGYEPTIKAAALNLTLKRAAEKKGGPLTTGEARALTAKFNREWSQHGGDSYRGDSSGGTSWRW